MSMINNMFLNRSFSMKPCLALLALARSAICTASGTGPQGDQVFGFRGQGFRVFQVFTVRVSVSLLIEAGLLLLLPFLASVPWSDPAAAKVAAKACSLF